MDYRSEMNIDNQFIGEEVYDLQHNFERRWELATKIAEICNCKTDTAVEKIYKVIEKSGM